MAFLLLGLNGDDWGYFFFSCLKNFNGDMIGDMIGDGSVIKPSKYFFSCFETF
jgi:hypothetical protein